MKQFMTIFLLAVLSLTASANYDEEVGLRYFSNENYKMALPMLQRAAKGGSLPALHALGQMYEHGWGVSANKTIMMNMYTKAEQGGYVPSMEWFAGYYWKEGNIDKAVEFWTKGAKSGGLKSLLAMGLCRELGIGCAKNLDVALGYYIRLADASPKFKENLASIYYLKGDYKNAYKIYWELYTSGGGLSWIGAKELVAILSSESSWEYTNPLASASVLDEVRKRNLIDAAEVWIKTIIMDEETVSRLHSFTNVVIDASKELSAFPEVEKFVEAYMADPDMLAALKKGSLVMGSSKPEPESSPLFPGGGQAMYKWLAENLHYPVTAAERKIQGRVVVGFEIDNSGNVQNVTILRGLDRDLDNEALSLIRSMPRWIPGKYKGQSVTTKHNIPINFRL